MPFRTIEVSHPGFTPEGVQFVTVKSAALQRRADITFYAPPGEKPEKLPLVILMHGVFGSHWAWLFKGGAHEVLLRLMREESLPPMLLAMPSDGLWGDGSGYVRHRAADYAKWIVDEVPEAAALVEPASRRAPHFICGLSMGGYGAMRLGALHADKFAGISAHSSAVDLAQLQAFVEEGEGAYDLLEEQPLTVLDCLTANAKKLPPLRFDCGAEDDLVEGNRALHRGLDVAGIPHAYEEFPGAHTWEYWHEHLTDSLRFFGSLVARQNAR